MSPLRAIVFDFDGVIVETEQPDYDTHRAIFAEYGVELPLDVWAGVVGGSGLDTLFDYFEGCLGRKVDRGRGAQAGAAATTRRGPRAPSPGGRRGAYRAGEGGGAAAGGGVELEPRVGERASRQARAADVRSTS